MEIIICALGCGKKVGTIEREEGDEFAHYYHCSSCLIKLQKKLQKKCEHDFNQSSSGLVCIECCVDGKQCNKCEDGIIPVFSDGSEGSCNDCEDYVFIFCPNCGEYSLNPNHDQAFEFCGEIMVFDQTYQMVEFETTIDGVGVNVRFTG